MLGVHQFCLVFASIGPETSSPPSCITLVSNVFIPFSVSFNPFRLLLLVFVNSVSTIDIREYNPSLGF